MNKEDFLQYIFNKVKSDFIKAGIPFSKNIDPVISISRALRRWGSCRKSLKHEDYIFSISISESCFNEPDYEQFIKNTMAHELIHTIDGCFNHGRGFKYYAAIANSLGYNVKTKDKSSVEKTDEEKFNEANHVLRCIACGEMYYRIRFPKKKGYINSIRCSKCGGKLEKIK